MAFYGSKLFVQVYISGTWVTVISKSDSLLISNEQVDVTDKSNSPWRNLAECGIRQASMSVSGFSQGNSAIKFCKQAAFNGSLERFRLIAEDGLSVLAEGIALISGLTRVGEYNGAEFYELSIEVAEQWFHYSVPPLPPPPPITGNEYSFALSLRKVVQTYDGVCIRVRRSIDNAEMDIGFGRDGLLDSSAILSFASGGSAYVVRWFNQYVGWPFQFVEQLSAGSQPAIVISGAIQTSSGKYAIMFDGVDDWLETPAENQIPQFSRMGRLSGVSVWRRDGPYGSGAGTKEVFGSQEDGGGYEVNYMETSQGGNVYMRPNRSGIEPSFTDWTTSNRKKSCAYAGTWPGTLEKYTDGVRNTPSVQSFSASGTNTRKFYVGRWSFSITRCWIGTIQEIIGTSKQWTSSELAEIASESANYYGTVGG